MPTKEELLRGAIKAVDEGDADLARRLMDEAKSVTEKVPEPYLIKPEVLDLRDFENELHQIVRQKFSDHTVKNIEIKSSNLTNISSMPIYKIEGYTEVITQPSGFLSSEKTRIINFSAKFHAQSGQFVGFEKID